MEDTGYDPISRVFTIFCVAFLCLFASHVAAQGKSTGALIGVVLRESGGILPGATIELSSAALIGAHRNTETDKQGRFRFSELPAGIYEAAIRLTGYNPLRISSIRISSGITSEITPTMVLRGGEETIIVEADPTQVDPTSSSMPVVLTTEFLATIPHDRDTSHLLNLAPGINIESAYGSASESGTAYHMDGDDVSDPQGGEPLSLFNASIIDEIQLVGLGAPAEYGQFTGVVYNIVTKSGGNEASGSAEFFYTGKALASESEPGSSAI